MAAEEFAEQPKVEKIINTEVFDSDCTGGAKSKTTKPSESQSSWRKSKKRKVTEDDMFGDSDDDMEGVIPREKLVALCKYEPIRLWMRSCDHILYQALVEILIPDVLRPVPSQYHCYVLMNFSFMSYYETVL